MEQALNLDPPDDRAGAAPARDLDPRLPDIHDADMLQTSRPSKPTWTSRSRLVRPGSRNRRHEALTLSLAGQSTVANDDRKALALCCKPCRPARRAALIRSPVLRRSVGWRLAALLWLERRQSAPIRR